MRTNAALAGLALMLGLAAPVAAVAAEPPDMSPAADEGMGSGGNRPGMHAQGHHGGWQRHMGQRGRSHGHHRPSFIGMLLRNRQQLGLTAQQVDSLRKLGMDSQRAEIRQRADRQVAQLDLMSLRFSDPVDMGKVEAKVREIGKLNGDGRIAAIRTAEAAKAQLTPEQREKLKGLWAARMQQRRGSGEGGNMHAPDSDRKQ